MPHLTSTAPPPTNKTIPPPLSQQHSPMLLPNLHLINLDPVRKPPRPLLNLHIIPTHLPLPHQPPLIESPVLQPIRPPPLSLLIKPLVPKLHRNLPTHISPTLPNSNPSQPSQGTEKHTLLSVKANNSFLNRYPFSLDHLSVKNLTIAGRPCRNVSRLRQIESGV